MSKARIYYTRDKIKKGDRWRIDTEYRFFSDKPALKKDGDYWVSERGNWKIMSNSYRDVFGLPRLAPGHCIVFEQITKKGKRK